MAKQDRVFIRTPAALEQKYDFGRSFRETEGRLQAVGRQAQQAQDTAQQAENTAAAARSEVLQLSDSISLSVENGETTAQIKLKVGDREIPATIDMKGLVTFTNLKNSGATKIDAGNIVTGRISSADGISLVIDLDKGTADLTGSLTTIGHWDESGFYRYTEVSPEGIHVWRRDAQYNSDETGITQGKVTVSEDFDRAELSSKTLRFVQGNGRISGLAAPVDSAEPVTKAYMEQYVWKELDKLREEIGLPVG